MVPKITAWFRLRAFIYCLRYLTCLLLPGKKSYYTDFLQEMFINSNTGQHMHAWDGHNPCYHVLAQVRQGELASPTYSRPHRYNRYHDGCYSPFPSFVNYEYRWPWSATVATCGTHIYYEWLRCHMYSRTQCPVDAPHSPVLRPALF